MDDPPVVAITSTSKSPPPSSETNIKDSDISPSCPFCGIARRYRPLPPTDPSNVDFDPDKSTPPSYVLLSTQHVVSFLDIAPLTRGHVLVAPRKHRVKVGDLSPNEMAEIGRVLPLVARAVIAAVLPDIPHDEADYNIVQNNGPGAAQVVPHVHFHIVPRPPLNYKPSPLSTSAQPRPPRKYARSQLPKGFQASYIQFGRGARNELDDEDAALLVKEARTNLQREWQRQVEEEHSSRGMGSTISASSSTANVATNQPRREGKL